MKYPINIFLRKHNPAINFLGMLFLIGVGVTFTTVALAVSVEKHTTLTEWFYVILSLITGILCIFAPITQLFLNNKTPAIQIDNEGITIDIFVKIGPIAWHDITDVIEFNHAPSKMNGWQRVKGIQINVGNPRKYIDLAKEQNMGWFINLRIITLSWLYFGKIKIPENALDIQSGSLSEIIQSEYDKYKFNPHQSYEYSKRLFG